MKKLLILTALLTFAAGVASAQNYAVVNSQKVYQALPKYSEAVAQLDSLASDYQKKVDTAFAKLEEMYNSYMVVKDGLSYEEQQSREQQIIDNEKKITEYQQSIFGSEGIIAKKQEETIKPFTEQFEEAVKAFAEVNNLDLLIDIASNPSVLYYKPEVDKTEQIINMLK